MLSHETEFMFNQWMICYMYSHIFLQKSTGNPEKISRLQKHTWVCVIKKTLEIARYFPDQKPEAELSLKFELYRFLCREEVPQR